MMYLANRYSKEPFADGSSGGPAANFSHSRPEARVDPGSVVAGSIAAGEGDTGGTVRKAPTLGAVAPAGSLKQALRRNSGLHYESLSAKAKGPVEPLLLGIVFSQDSDPRGAPVTAGRSYCCFSLTPRIWFDSSLILFWPRRVVVLIQPLLIPLKSRLRYRGPEL